MNAKFFNKTVFPVIAVAITLLFTLVLPASAASGIFESYIVVNTIWYDAGATTVTNPDFQGTNFGSFDPTGTLTLNGGQIKTWKNGTSNVTGAKMYYRVYSGTAGSFTEIDLPWRQDINSSDQRWDTTTAGINLLNGLSAGIYTLEIYFKATTNEGDQYHNNGGANYKATFTVNAVATLTPTPVTPTATNTPVTPTATPLPPNWVGDMYPAGGSSNSINESGSFTVYVQVLKSGVTEAAGQGAGIICKLHWGQVNSFGGAWTVITDTVMSYNVDKGNNDEYETTISPSAGLYEFTAICSTMGGDTVQGSGNGKLTVNGPTATPTNTSTATNTPTNTPVSVSTNTPTPTSTPTNVSTATSTATPDTSLAIILHYKGYTNPKIYAWSGATQLRGAWPGTTMTFEANGWFKDTITGYSTINLIFNDGGTGKTPDLSQTVGEWWYTNATWTNVNPDTFTATPAPVSTATATPMSSSLGYVGDMFPPGGFTHSIPKGSPVDVYVQVYKTNVTPGLGQGAGIKCTLSWGEVNSFGDVWLNTTNVLMTYNAKMMNPAGDNDEYTAQFTPLPGKKYEFTAFCDDGGAPVEQNKGKARILALKKSVFIQLFEWKWKDIAKECEQFLGPKGFGAVQVSPPQENALVASSGGGAYPWWQRYQVVSYKIESRSGTRAEFADMVQRCNAAGVEIYADAVINHTANGSGTGQVGSTFANYNYPMYTPSDFHSCKTAISDYGNKYDVQNCELADLDDLDTGSNSVRDKIAAYMNDLISLGVTGFRLDAAKHMANTDIEAIISRLSKPVYIYSEVIASSSEAVQASEYTNIGQISEFLYGTKLQEKFRYGKLADLNNGGVLFARDWSGFLNSNKAVVFTDNHDNQRGHGGGGTPLTYRDGQLYILGNVFLLAWPYGYPGLMSSYYINTPINPDTTGSVGPPTDPADATGKTTKDVYIGNTAANCAPDFYTPKFGDWICEQHQRGIGNMVGFRNYVADVNSVDNWWSNGNNQIAFGRGNKGFVVINRESSTLTSQFTTGLADGVYCNIIDGELNGNSCTGSVVVVTGGAANITVAGMNAVAIYNEAKLTSASVSDVGLKLTSLPAPSIPGQAMTYTLIVTNAGMSINGLTIIDALPSALNTPTWTCQADASSSCAMANGNGDLNQTVNIGANGQLTFIIKGTLANGTAATVINQASVTLPSGVVDANLGNNIATDNNTPNTSTTGLNSVTLAGTFEPTFGCVAWDATCAATRFTFMGNGVWRAELTIPAGNSAYKAVLNNDWANGSYPSANKTFTLGSATTVRFYYDDKTKTVYDSVSGKVAVAVGSFQSELGCVEKNNPGGGGDWEPACVRTLMTDLNNDGTYTFQTSSLPAGSYSLKVALNEAWTNAYPSANVNFSVNWVGELVTARWNSTSNAVTVDTGSTRAFWLDKETIAWNPATGSTFKLRYAPTGGLDLVAGTGNALNLSEVGTVNVANYPKFPNLGGYRALKISATDLSKIPDILKGQIALSLEANGELDATGIQIQGVLDDLYTYNGNLGLNYSGGVPSLKLWAPTAKSVTLRVYDNSTTASSTAVPMTLDAVSGVWSVTGQAVWDKKFYLYDVEVYVHATGQVEHNLVTDPYAVTLSTNPLVDGAPANTQRSQIVDLYNDASLKPAGWDALAKPPLDAPEDMTVYELHVRDFSINDSTVPAAHRGTFMAFTDTGSNGMKHLKALAEAGLTHIHLLPTEDSGVMVESVADQKVPGDLSGFAPDSDKQQAAIAPLRDQDGFNWGYETQHYGAPEGAFSTDPNGTARIIEFRQMVKALSDNKLRVVMDVVYNHTYRAGQESGSVLDKIVPGYYQRCNNQGDLEKQSCCPDSASEFNMMEKLIVDTVVRWAKAYKVDGFRFDLMNFETVENIVKVKNAVQSLTPAADGVDGSKIYLYGEGWDFGSAKDKGLNYAKQWNMAGTGIGTFNDKIRDSAHGGYSSDPTAMRTQGFINGLSYDWNGYFYGGRDLGDLRYQTDKLRMALAGSLQNYQFTDQNGATVKGMNFGGYTLDPQETINYVEKHDNETLYDQNVYKLPLGTSMADRVRAQNMGLSIIGLAQGIPFVQLGTDMLRSKSLDRDSYNSGDWFNKIDFTYNTNNFGVGLPPAWGNDPNTKWPIMRPLLANTALKPAKSDILNSVESFKETLRIRQSSKLFRLRTADDIMQRVKFYNTGSNQKSGFIVMSLSDKVGTDLDPNYKMIVVLFNANKVAQTFQASDFVGLPLSLHPLTSDALAKTATFDGATGLFNVPARTTAVFVEQQTSVNLAISQTGTPKPAIPGAAIAYTIVVSNIGTGAVNGATILDTLPSGITNITWQCTPSAGATCANGTGNLNDTISLPIGGRITYAVNGLIAPSATGQLVNTAIVTITTDLDPSNNTAVDTVTLTPQANLSILNISSPSPGVAGQPITYTITVQNTGPSDAVNASVSNNLPATVLTVTWTCSSQTPGAACGKISGAGNIVDTVNIPVGGKLVYLAKGTLAGGTDPINKPITNTAVVTPNNNTTDPDPNNNHSTDTTAPKADLVVTMSSQPSSFIPGQAVTYTIVVSNVGPNNTSARVFNFLPVELSNVQWTCASNGVVCTAAGSGKLDDTILSFPVGKVATYTVKAVLNSTATATVTNIVNVQVMSATVTDPDNYNNEAKVANVPALFNLYIIKNSQPDLFIPGQTVTYTLLVGNSGPDVSGAKVGDTLPSGLSNVTWRCTGTCTANGTGNLNDTVNLPMGSQLRYTITAKVSTALTGSLINTATITAPSGVVDVNPNDNSSVKNNRLSPQADVSVNLTGPTQAMRGAVVTYTLVVSNAGPSDAPNTKIVARLSLSGTTWTCLATSGSTCGNGTGNVSDTANLLANGRATYTIVGTFILDGVNQAMGEAEAILAAGVLDPTTPNYVNSVTAAREEVDLTISKQAQMNEVSLGSPITYTLTITNNGPDAASNVTVVDSLPNGLAVELKDVTSNGTCIMEASVITCTLGQVSAGATSIIKVVGAAMLPGTLVNTATVSSATTEPNKNNNSATASVTVKGADLAISLDSYPKVINLGNPFTYTLAVVNNGPDEANQVVASSSLPAGVAFVSASVNCQNVSGLVNCTFDKLANGAKVEASIVVTTVLTGTWVNTATVTAVSADPLTDNNVASTTVKIVPVDVPLVDLVVTKQAWPQVGIVNEPLTYTIVLTNRGPFDISEMLLVDILPAAVQFGTLSNPLGLDYTSFCGVAMPSSINCRLTNLVKDAYATITIVVTPTTSGQITNTVTVTAPQQIESHPSDNAASVSTIIGHATSAITPDQPATLTYLDSTTISAPPKAVTDSLILLYTKIDTKTVVTTQNDFTFTGRAFALDALRNGVVLPNFRFNEPLEITLAYSDSEVADLDENSLTLYYLDTQQTPARWVDAATTCTPASTITRQPDKNLMSVKVCHLTDFAMFGQAKTIIKPTLKAIYLPVVIKK